MARISASDSAVGLDMTNIPQFGGNIEVNSGLIIVTYASHTQEYYGSFSFTQTEVRGTLSSTHYSNSLTGLKYSATDFTFDANLAASYIVTENAQLLIASVMEGSDQVIGSSSGDILLGFEGNDQITGGLGNDVIAGGTGTDLAVFNRQHAEVNIVRTNDGMTVGLKSSNGDTDALFEVERLRFTDKDIAFDGTAAAAYRLYQAAFDRKPDTVGLGYWIAQCDKGLSLYDAAWNFINSAEFARLYGTNISNGAFITALYDNVLHRAPDQSGFNYWNEMLSTGKVSRHAMLAEFSESPENQAQVIGSIQSGVEYTPFG
jgi:hypothetical protein